EDLTLTVTKDGTLVEDSDDGTIEPEEAQAPTVEAFIFKDEVFTDYYRLSFATEEEVSAAYLAAITSVKIDDIACTKVSSSFWNHTNSYKFSADEAYGGENQFIDFTADCFSAEGSHTVCIQANGYQDLTFNVTNGQLAE